MLRFLYPPTIELHLSAKNTLLSPIEISCIYADVLCLRCTLRPEDATQNTMKQWNYAIVEAL